MELVFVLKTFKKIASSLNMRFPVDETNDLLLVSVEISTLPIHNTFEKIGHMTSSGRERCSGRPLSITVSFH